MQWSYHSQQFGPDSNSGIDAPRGLSLSFVLSLALRAVAFSPGNLGFPSPLASKFQFDQELKVILKRKQNSSCVTKLREIAMLLMVMMMMMMMI